MSLLTSKNKREKNKKVKNGNVCGKPYGRDENHGGMKDGVSLSLKDCAILRKFKDHTVFLFRRSYTFWPFFLTQISPSLSSLFAQQYSPLIVQGTLLAVQGQMSYSHSLLQTLIQLSLVLFCSWMWEENCFCQGGGLKGSSIPSWRTNREEERESVRPKGITRVFGSGPNLH